MARQTCMHCLHSAELCRESSPLLQHWEAQKTENYVMGIQRLPRAVSATIVSTSSVQSQVSVLKELVENSIDAIGDLSQGQIYVEIDKESAGLDFLSVKDNGSGVDKADRNVMCLNCTTSKLSSMDQLSSGVTTCGFRGEALNFIAHLAKTLQISTKTKSDITMETWSINSSGLSNSDSKVSPGSVGTTIRVFGLFKETPVRYKFLKEKKAKLLKSMEHLIIEYALVYRHIRFQLRYVKLLPNGRTVNGDCKSYPHKISSVQMLSDVLDIRKKNWLFEQSFEFEVTGGLIETFTVKADILLPRMRAQDIPSAKYNFKLLAINKRPLDLSLKLGKLISAKINEVYSENMLLAPPVWFVCISIPPDKVDVNIEPGKCDMIVCNEEAFIEGFRQRLMGIVANEHGIEGEDVVKDFLSENMKTFEIPPLRAENHQTLSHNGEIEQFSHAENDLNVNFSTEKTGDFLESNDESFVQELDSTIKNIKDRYYNNDINNQNRNPNLESKDPKESNLFVPDFDETTEHDNDWSSTVYDTTRFSSEIDIADEINSFPTKCTEAISPSDLLMNGSASKLREIAPSESELNANHTASETLVDIGSPADKILDASTAELCVDTVENLIPESKPKKSHSLKQMAVSSYLTYHISPPKKREPPLREHKVFRIGDLSQDTIGDTLTVAFNLSMNVKNRHFLLAEDERWINRSGIPSTSLVNCAIDLYKRASHMVNSEEPKLDESGIYQLK